MNYFVNKHQIHSVIYTIYPFEHALEAYEHLARAAFGKIVIDVETR